jgi:hypothetical protein
MNSDHYIWFPVRPDLELELGLGDWLASKPEGAAFVRTHNGKPLPNDGLPETVGYFLPTETTGGVYYGGFDSYEVPVNGLLADVFATCQAALHQYWKGRPRKSKLRLRAHGLGSSGWNFDYMIFHWPGSSRAFYGPAQGDFLDLLISQTTQVRQIQAAQSLHRRQSS